MISREVRASVLVGVARLHPRRFLRGARIDAGRAVHLLSAMTHTEGATIAQRDVDQKTNEITGFRPLLERLDLEGVVVTADALHAQREHTRFLVAGARITCSG